MAPVSTLGPQATPLKRRIGNVIVPFAPTGRTSLMERDVPIGGTDAESETPSCHLPQRGNAYQPRASALGIVSERMGVF